MPTLTGMQLLAVRAGRRGRLAAVRGAAGELRQLAEHHCARLVYIADHAGDRLDLADRRMRSALTALAGPLTQPSA